MRWLKYSTQTQTRYNALSLSCQRVANALTTRLMVRLFLSGTVAQSTHFLTKALY